MRPILTCLALALASPALACDANLITADLVQCMLGELTTVQSQLQQAYNASRTLNRRLADLQTLTLAQATLIADLQSALAAQSVEVNDLQGDLIAQGLEVADLQATRLTQADLDAAGYAPGLLGVVTVTEDGDLLITPVESVVMTPGADLVATLPGHLEMTALAVDLTAQVSMDLLGVGGIDVRSSGVASINGALVQLAGQVVASSTVIAPEVIAGGTSMATLNGRVTALENAP